MCYRCRAFDREVFVCQSYFHFCFIPCFPVGPKTVEMRCRSCGDDTRLESVVAAHPPRRLSALYLYSGPFLAVLLVAGWLFWRDNDVKNTERFLAAPAIGDVYTLEEESGEGTIYRFLRVAGLKGDSTFMMESHLVYTGFVSDLSENDYFDSSDTVVYTKRKLHAMQDDKNLTRIERGYSKTAGFNRIK